MEAIFPYHSEDLRSISEHAKKVERIDILKDWSIISKKTKKHDKATEDRITEIDAVPLQQRSVETVMYALELTDLIRQRGSSSLELRKLQLQIGSHLTPEQAEAVAHKLDAVEHTYVEGEILANEVHSLVTGANELYSQYKYAQEASLKTITEDFSDSNNTVLHALKQMANHRPTPHIGPLVHRQSEGIVRTIIAGELGRELPAPPSALESV